MTPDETLRALAALEAAWRRDELAVTALARRGPGEVALPILVAEYGEQVLGFLVALAFGVREGMEPQALDAVMEEIRGDVTARMCHVLGQTLKSWAANASDEASADIARAVLTGILNFTENAGEDDVLPLLARLRASALEST
ncbi:MULTISPECIES: hypothetical protein [unclassified Kitasatospora]|uniref:hypothetical protein n=1 Tax=unclassified Kitasatospora TaxID=2633591 RepID=UPI0024745CC6|nr:hypothetical protein [Kitasatospora sp. MAP12-44]